MARTNDRRPNRLLRAAKLLPFLPLAGRAPAYARLLLALTADARVPISRKVLLAMAGAYIVSPIDVIPDRIPIVGTIDDVIVMMLAVDVFLDGLPEGLINEKLADVGMTLAELDQDLERVRKFVPKGLRRIMARVPDALDGAAQFITDNGIDRQLRDGLGRLVARTQEYRA